MPNEASLVQQFFIRSLDKRMALVEAFGSVEHEGVVGVLRESLVEAFVEPLLMPPYRAGTGVIVDSVGNQSGQCDIVIWDDSIFRPLYEARGAGIHFIEAVVAVIEVKSTLNRDSVRQAFERAKEFKEMSILRPRDKIVDSDFWGPEPGILPLNVLFGFRSDIGGSEHERAQSVADEDPIDLHQYLQLLVVSKKESWSFQQGGARGFPVMTEHPYHEVLMPFAGIFNSLKAGNEKLR